MQSNRLYQQIAQQIEPASTEFVAILLPCRVLALSSKNINLSTTQTFANARQEVNYGDYISRDIILPCGEELKSVR